MSVGTDTSSTVKLMIVFDRFRFASVVTSGSVSSTTLPLTLYKPFQTPLICFPYFFYPFHLFLSLSSFFVVFFFPSWNRSLPTGSQAVNNRAFDGNGIQSRL